MNDLLSNFFSASNFCFTVPLFELLSSFLLNTIVVFIIVHFLYYPKGRRRDYYFTFLMLSISIFMLIYLLLGNSSDMGIGAALGLFAIFGIIRYRTESVPIREMTYLFIFICVAVINGLALNISYVELIVANLLLLLLIWTVEGRRLLRHTSAKLVIYEKINLITPDKREEMIADLEERLGHKVNKVEVGHVDFLRDVAFVKVYYELPEGETNTVEEVTKPNQFV